MHDLQLNPDAMQQECVPKTLIYILWRTAYLQCLR